MNLFKLGSNDFKNICLTTNFLKTRYKYFLYRTNYCLNFTKFASAKRLFGLKLRLMKNIKIKVKDFDALSLSELYELLKLRSEVFVVEQNCVYQDIDGKDQKSKHLMLFEADRLAAYCRLLPPGLSFSECSIGRVISAPEFRGKGYGQLLMQAAIEQMNTLFPQQNIRIGAQAYLQKFYESFGFKQDSDIYLEDGIPHMEMIKSY